MSATEFGVQQRPKFERPANRPKANWTRAFPDQQRALHPDRGPAGGVKARSAPEAVRMAVYLPIAALYKAAHPQCECCEARGVRFPRPTRDIHHTKGRDGLLLFDVRWFKSACGECHRWVDENRELAAQLGLLDLGNWGKQ